MIEWYLNLDKGTLNDHFWISLLENNVQICLNWTEIEIFKYPPYDWEYEEQVTSTETQPVWTRVRLRLWR